MRAMLALTLLASAFSGADALAMPPPSAAPTAPWGSFSRSSADGRNTTDVDVSSVMMANTVGARPETTWINEKTERIWVARKRVIKTDAPAILQWADSRACFQLVETLSTLIDLDQPAGAPVLTVVDKRNLGVLYRIDAAGLSMAKGPSADVRLTSGKDVPAGVIVDAALAAWAPCWSDTPPDFNPKP